MQTVEAGDLTIGDGHPPRIMGVLNLSEESPYDPSVFSDPATAADYVEGALIEAGADIVDVGLESANKRLDVLSQKEELERLHLAVETIDRVEGDAVFSIETRYAAVADEALARGFDMVNDVCGFADPDMPDVANAHDVPVVKMASPPDVTRPGAVDDVDWASVRSPEWAESATHVDKVYAALERGPLPENAIVDPAFGGWSASKTLEDDRATFRRLREFAALDRPILVSINRKNFLRTVVDRSTEDALPVSLGATALAVERGADVIRTHDVRETRDAARIGATFARNRVRTEAVEELPVRTRRELERHVARVGATADDDHPLDRVVAIEDLSPAERKSLREAIEGSSLRTYGDGRLVVVGSLPDFEATADAISGHTPSLTAVSDALERVVSNEKTYTGWG
ncbi:MAG: dihydropteroate synthase [Halanaeroarchaeum sp.]